MSSEMRRPQAGYVLIVLLLMVTLVLISLSAAVPTVLYQAQREDEEELIFRGEQYKHAIGLYYKKYGRYPLKLEELLWTNDRAYLRRPYPDAVTPGGQWRFIRLGPGGALLGSTQGAGPQDSAAPSSGPGARPRAGGSGSSEIATLPLAGVASRSTKRSLRLYQDYSQYSQWEFIYDPVKEALQNRPGVPGATPGKTPPGSSSKPSKPN